MTNKLKIILREVTGIQAALLKFRHKEGQKRLHVKIMSANDDLIHCAMTDEMPPEMKTGYKMIHLVQKKQGDYFFISGYISMLARDSGFVSITINKASWFVKKRRGSVTWLQEKHTYENGREVVPAF